MSKGFKSGMYRFANLLSLDVSLGAVICAGFFSKVFGVRADLYATLVLGLSVWIIYTADHLLDARKTKALASTRRHQFHQRNFNILAGLLAVAVVLNVIFLFIIPRIMILPGIILGVIVVMYLLAQQYLILMKEFSGAILYTAGVSLPAVAYVWHGISGYQLILLLHFMLTAWMNLLLFSLFDKRFDERDRHTSFATTVGESTVSSLIFILFVFCLGLTFYETTGPFSIPSLVVLFMDVVLLIILIMRKHFDVQDRYRLLGDAVFLFPALYILILIL